MSDRGRSPKRRSSFSGGRSASISRRPATRSLSRARASADVGSTPSVPTTRSTEQEIDSPDYLGVSTFSLSGSPTGGESEQATVESPAQATLVSLKDALASYGANYAKGLTAAEATDRRRDVRHGGLNTVQKPINCPSWVCCLLPCILKIPSMKLFKLIQPDDAEVLRDGRWVRYDAPSLVRGDIIRLEEGDVVPADCTVLSLGLDPVDIDGPTIASAAGIDIELVVDVKDITGEIKPRLSKIRSDGTAAPIQIFYGSHINQGSCIAVVTAIGKNTMLSTLIQDKRWPPKGDLSVELQREQPKDKAEEDEEVGVALIERASS